jgi:hypothetical protein
VSSEEKRIVKPSVREHRWPHLNFPLITPLLFLEELDGFPAVAPIPPAPVWLFNAYCIFLDPISSCYVIVIFHSPYRLLLILDLVALPPRLQD